MLLNPKQKIKAKMFIVRKSEMEVSGGKIYHKNNKVDK